MQKFGIVNGFESNFQVRFCYLWQQKKGGQSMKKYTPTTELTPEELQARREYFKKWRAKNKDKQKIYQKKYWAKVVELAKTDQENNQDSSSD